MHFLLVGLNHKTASVAIREALSFPADEAGLFAGELQRSGVVVEAAVLSTCNRTEIYAASTDTGALSRISHSLAKRANRTVIPIDALYKHIDREAVHHLFTVASGLDSLVLGEPQILGQVRTALESARQSKSAGVYMGQLFRRAIEVGKRVRTETEVGAGAASISHAAVELARKIFGALSGKTVLLVGAGEMAELAARNLQAHGVERVHVANRTLERAQALAMTFHGEAYSLDALPAALIQADICITSTGARTPIIPQEMVRQTLRQRRGRPLFIIDIAVPRNVDPAVHKLDGVFVYSIDDLQAVVEGNLALRREQAVMAEKIVNAETNRLCAWMHEQKAVPLVLALRQRADDLVSAELDRVARRRPGFSSEDRAVVQAALESLANKLLHSPTIGLRTAAGTDTATLELAASLLGLSKPAMSQAKPLPAVNTKNHQGAGQ